MDLEQIAADFAGPYPEAFMAGLAHGGRLGLNGELAEISADDEGRRAAYRAGVERSAALRGELGELSRAAAE